MFRLLLVIPFVVTFLYGENLPIHWMRRGESEVWSQPIGLSFHNYWSRYMREKGMGEAGEIVESGYVRHFYESWYRETFWYYSYAAKKDEDLFQYDLYPQLLKELKEWMRVEGVSGSEEERILQNFSEVWKVAVRAENKNGWNVAKADIGLAIEQHPLPSVFENLLLVLGTQRPKVGKEQEQALHSLIGETHPALGAMPVRAHFLLGLALMEKDQDAALQQFRLLQEKVAGGAPDPDRCVEQSYGWESMIPYQKGEWLQALHGYLKSNAVGVRDYVSLYWTLDAMKRLEVEQLKQHVDDEAWVRLLTAWILSDERTQRNRSILAGWMPLVWDSPFLQKEPYILALAAYELGDKERCVSYLNLLQADQENEITCFLRARLALEDGQEEQAIAYYDQVLSQYVEIEEVHGLMYWHGGIQRALTERGFLHLKRNEYLSAMNWLVYTQVGDVAMLAERILTLDELIAYASAPNVPKPDSEGLRQLRPYLHAQPVKKILARRLARLDRWQEAIAWFEKNDSAEATDYARQVLVWKQGLEQDTLSNKERAEILWQIAQHIHAYGMKLIGTEYDPDYIIHHGLRDFPVFYNAEVFRVRKPFPYSEETLQRIRESAPEPNLRWHYRYVAAEYGWQAAQLLPNNDERTAHILWQSGRWLMYQNPQYADRFYKSMVRRNRDTELGKAADKLRWFPKEWPMMNTTKSPSH